MDSDLSDTNRLQLSKEYELCQSSAANLESLIWQTGAAIGLGSVGTLIVVSNHKPDDQPPAIVAIAIGALISLAAAMWWRMARRWWSIQHTKFVRMAQIEPKLGYFQARILEYLDAQSASDRSAIEIPEEYLKSIHILANNNRHQSAGVQYFLKYLPWVVSSSWLLYVGYLLKLWTGARNATGPHFWFCLSIIAVWLSANVALLICRQGLHLPFKPLAGEPFS